MRRWNIQIFLLNEHGEEMPASIFSKVVYKLHPTFEKRAVQCITSLSYIGRGNIPLNSIADHLLLRSLHYTPV